jgi:hypothetical protein
MRSGAARDQPARIAAKAVIVAESSAALAHLEWQSEKHPPHSRGHVSFPG